MGKKAKEHRKKVAKRNEKIKIEKNRDNKSAMNFLKKMIEMEKQRGAFNSPVQTTFEIPKPDSNFSGPQL
jgi:hypothetical protein